jgi:hypothetical protein
LIGPKTSILQMKYKINFVYDLIKLAFTVCINYHVLKELSKDDYEIIEIYYI